MGYQLDNVYASSSDPAVEKHDNTFAWSRPLEDHSRVLLVYPHHHAIPYIAPINTAEKASSCASFPTPNDLSETFLPKRQPAPCTVFGRRAGGDAMSEQAIFEQALQGPSLMDFPFRDNREAVLLFLYIANKGAIPYLHAHLNFDKIKSWAPMLGTAKVLWQELANKIQNQNAEAQKAMLAYWPTE